MRHAAEGASQRGMRPVIYNHCGVADAPVTSGRLYCAAFTADLRQAIAHVHELHPGAPITVAAFSIGANVLVHFLAEEAEARCGWLYA